MSLEYIIKLESKKVLRRKRKEKKEKKEKKTGKARQGKQTKTMTTVCERDKIANYKGS